MAFPNEQAALKRVYIAVMSLDPAGKGQARWDHALEDPQATSSPPCPSTPLSTPLACPRNTSTIKVLRRPIESTEYTSEAFQQLCGRWGVVQSMGRVGSALDNAAAESFHSVLKAEYVHRQTFATRAEARLKNAMWIADFCNTKQRHSAAGGKPHVEFERLIQEARARTGQEGRAV